MRPEINEGPPQWWRVLWHRIKLAYWRIDTRHLRKRYIRLKLRDDMINDLQRDSIVQLVKRAKAAHYANIVLRINGNDEIIQADWLKHLTFAKS